jgi:hypothetical protein
MDAKPKHKPKPPHKAPRKLAARSLNAQRVQVCVPRVVPIGEMARLRWQSSEKSVVGGGAREAVRVGVAERLAAMGGREGRPIRLVPVRELWDRAHDQRDKDGLLLPGSRVAGAQPRMYPEHDVNSHGHGYEHVYYRTEMLKRELAGEGFLFDPPVAERVVSAVIACGGVVDGRRV